MYLDLRERLIPLGLGLRSVQLDPRGAWLLTLQNGIDIRLGRRNIDDRADLFLGVVAGIVSDREADTKNRVRTTAVFSVAATTGMLAVVCAGLALVLVPTVGPVWSLTAFVPLALHLASFTISTAWWLSRVYFGVTLIVALGGFSGSP